MKTIKLFGILILAFLFCRVDLHAQWSSDIQQDQQILHSLFNQVKADEGASIGVLMRQCALFFLNTPYVDHTLEVAGAEERFVINLRELDCMTFMETCVALCYTIETNTLSFEAYCKYLERIRYRVGVINGYTSRLHYMTDWIADNRAKGMVDDITKSIGGEPFKVQLSYMSSHSDAYVHLKGQPERTARIRQIEDLINKRGGYYYIPKQEIPSIAELIQNGDVICFTTSIEGMDVSHVGIAYWRGDELTFIHASSTAQKVIVEPVSLFEYCQRISSNTGIMVLRCKELSPAVTL